MNAAAKNTKTAAVCITITRAEGPTHLCKTRVFAGLDCWEKSRAFMRANLDTFPASGGYDKHDFTVVRPRLAARRPAPARTRKGRALGR